MPVNFDEYVVETPKKTIDFDSYQAPSKISFDDYQVDEVSKGLELAYPENLEPTVPVIEPGLGASSGDLLRRIPAGIAEAGADAVSGLLKVADEFSSMVPGGPAFERDRPRYQSLQEAVKRADEELRIKNEGVSDNATLQGNQQEYVERIAPIMAAMRQLEQNPDNAVSTAASFMREVSERSKDDYGVDPKRDQAFLSQVASGFGSIVPAMASGPAAPVTVAAMMGESGRKEAEQAGATPEQQDKAFYGNAAVGVLSEALMGVPALIRSVRAAKIPQKTFEAMAKSAAFEAFKSGLREGTQESIEQTANNLIAKYVAEYDPNRPELQGAWRSFLVGAVSGAPVGGAVQATQNLLQPNIATPTSIAEPVVNIEAGTIETPDGRTVTVDETGVTEVVPGSPKDISTELLVPKKGEPDAVQEQSPDEGVLRPETTGEEGVGLPQVGKGDTVVETPPETPKIDVESPPGPPPPVEPVENRGRPPLPEQTGIRNAIVDQNRVAQGLPPRMEILRKSFGNEWVRAMEMVEQNPNSGSILVSEIAKTPRALTPTENALFLHEQVTRENNYNQALREVNEATTEADRVAAEAKLTFARDQNQEIYDAGQNAGTAAGQDLAFRKMLVNRDYSLASIETELTALKQPKTPQEAKAVQAEAAELHSRIKQAEERARVAEEKLAQAQAHEEWLKLQKIARSESSAARKEGKSILDRIISTGEQAQKRIRERNLKAMREGVRMQLLPFNILDFPDHVLVGAGYIAKGVKTLADFTKRFTDDFGPEAEPHAPRVFEAASKYHEEAVSRVPKIETVQQAAAKDVEGNLNPQVVYDIARAHVNAGTQGFEPTMQATLATLKSKHPDLTMREVRDVFSGYGKVTRPSQAADKVKLSEYRELARIASGIEDALKGKAPLKSGFQRNKPTEQIRSDLAKLKRAMEENGIQVTSPEQQLANAERSATTRLQNTIESLERQIATKTRDLPASRKGVDTPEIRKLKSRVSDLRTTLDSLVPSPGISEGQRNTNAIKAAQKSIEALDQQIKSGNLAPKNVPRGTVSPELEALRSERDAMRRFILEKRNEAKTKRSAEEIALDRYKKSLATRTKEIQDRIDKNDYVKRPRKETALDKEALDAKFEYQKAKDAFEQKAFEYDLSRRGTAKKAYDTFLEVLNTSRSIMTSFDVSAPLRQGAFITLAHPIRSLKNFPGMFRAFASERAAFELQESLTDPTKRPNASLYRSSGLDLTDVGTNVTRRKMEEAYQSRFARKIPIVGGSQRAYTTFLNQLRADSFDAMVKNLAKGGKVTDQEAKAIASFINGATGRVKFPGQLEQSTQFLNSVFFAPKYVASRLKLIADPITGFSISTGFKGKGTAGVRKALAVEYARFLTGAAIVLGLARLGGAEIEEDPRSSDFLSIKMGNTRLDILGGLKQIVTLAARMRTGENKSLKTGRIEKINPVDVMDKFVEYKLAPIFSTTRSLISGKDPVGQPITKTGAALQLVTPLPFGDIIDAMVEQGIPRGTAISIVSLFGASMSTFDARRREKVARQPWEEVARDFRKISEKPIEGRRGF